MTLNRSLAQEVYKSYRKQMITRPDQLFVEIRQHRELFVTDFVLANARSQQHLWINKPSFFSKARQRRQNFGFVVLIGQMLWNHAQERKNALHALFVI